MVWVNMVSVGEILNYEDKAYDKICLTTIKEDEVMTTVLDLVIMVKQGFSISWGIMVSYGLNLDLGW
jgi:hypothetical protein